MSMSNYEPEKRSAQRRRTKRRLADVSSIEILESMSDGFVAVNREWRYTYVNRAAERNARLRREEMLGRNVWELFPEYTPEFKRALHRAMDEGVTVHFEEYCAPLDRWFEQTVYPAAEGITVYARDVTERKRAEVTLRDSEEKYRTLFNSIDEGFCVFEMLYDEQSKPDDLRYLEVNSTFEKQMGLSQITGKTERELGLNLEQSLIETYDRVAVTGEAVRFESRVEAVDRWFDIYAYRVGSYGSRKVAVLFNNITARKRAEEELRSAHDKLERRVEERTATLSEMNNILSAEIVERQRAEGLWREAHARDEMILDSITDKFFAVDNEWRYTTFNKHAEEQLEALGKDPASLIGRVLWDEFPNPASGQELRRAMTERVVVTHEHYFPPLGEWVENRIYPSPDGGLAIFQRYVTERKRAEEELSRSETSQAEGQRLTHTGSGVWNVATNEVVWSQEMYRIYGFEPGSVSPCYELFMQIVHPDDRLRVDQILQKLVGEEIGYDVEFRIVRPNGEVRHLHSMGHPVFDESGKLTEVIGTILDATERKQAEEERGKLLRRLMAAQEEERIRIARQLHDQMGQNVSALNLKLAMLQCTHGGQTDVDEQYETLRAIAKQLERDVDFLVWELRPTALDDLGLLTALSNYAQNWSKHFGVRAELHDVGMEKQRLSGEIESVLYRATQEALTNIAKHASASNVSILLERRSNIVSLIIEDDGVGFDAEQAFSAEQKGVGLLGMRERVSLVDGTVEVESTPGNGVTVAVRIPATRAFVSGEHHE
jgi:PAS domain S-box-containing protein